MLNPRGLSLPKKLSDREFALKRQIKDLEEKNRLLELEIELIKRQQEKTAEPVKKSKKEKAIKDCPDCGAGLKTLPVPQGDLSLCSKSCGYRKIIVKKVKSADRQETSE